MKAVITLYTNRLTEFGYPVVAYFRSPEIRKRVAISKLFKNDLYYFQKNEWDFVNEVPVPSAKNYDLVYPKLVNFKKAFENLMLKNETDVNAYLRLLNENDTDLQINLLEKQLANLKNNTSVGVLQFFDTIISEKEKIGASVSIYSQTKTQIEKFIVNDCSLNTINYEWLHKFILFKKQQGAKEAGIMVYLRTLRALYKEAQRRDSLNVKPGNPFLGMIKNSSAPVEVDFKIAYFEKIINYIPKASTNIAAAFNMKRAVNIWLFQFLIGGSDFVDVALLSWKQVKNNRVKFRRYKNRSKPQGGPLIDNMLCSRALEIINNYGTKNNERIFGFIPHPKKTASTYVNYRSNFNRTLSTISVDLELPSVLKSKSTRYIFRSIAGELLIADLVIFTIMGHKPKGVSFSYQGKLPNKIIDEHLQKIIDATSL